MANYGADVWVHWISAHGWVAGVLGLLQIGVLPGLAALAGLRSMGWMLRSVMVLCTSLVLNFELSFLLVGLGIYNFIAMTISLVLQIVLWWWLSHNYASQRVSAASYSEPSPELTVAQPWLHAAGLLTALGASLWLFAVLLGHIPSPFSAWDTVVSWNRWALDWYEGRLPRHTYGYPQLIPASWGTSYLWLGSSRVDMFAKAFMGLFPVGVVILFFDRYWRFRQLASLVAVVLWCLLVVKVFPDLMDSGYVDIAVTFFIALTAHLIILIHRGHLPSRVGWCLVACAASAALLTKQSGVLAVLLALCGFLWTKRKSIDTASSRVGDFACLLGLMSLLVAPWLIHLFLQFSSGADASNVSYVTSNIYGNETLPARVWRSVSRTLPAALVPLGYVEGWLVAGGLLMVLALRDSLGRVSALIAVAYGLVWAAYFSYDIRNILPAVPFACLAIGIGVEQAMRWVVKPGILQWSLPWRVQPTRDRLVIQWAVVVTILLGVMLLLPNSSVAELSAENERLRRLEIDAELNQALLDYASSPGFEGKVLTSYAPFAAIEGLREHVWFRPENPSPSKTMINLINAGAPMCTVVEAMPGRKDVQYLFLHKGLYPAVIEQSLSLGQLTLIFEKSGLRLLRMTCPN
ncbi:MAG: hypothetical protein H7293_12450 [Candidatus Saccharibacteria bacterium]|nr:hypothetical protein [Rhodoferax sp.]